MAEPASLASGILALVVLAHKSCFALHTAIQGFKSYPRRVRDLIEELEALISVLELLGDTMRAHADIKFPALNLPLQRCGRACDEFLQELRDCYTRSRDDRRSYWDWAKLKYMSDNIGNFKDLLAACKSTINIALSDLQL